MEWNVLRFEFPSEKKTSFNLRQEHLFFLTNKWNYALSHWYRFIDRAVI